MPRELFFQGLLLGFSIAAPVGPIGLLCIRRSWSGGARTGFASGLGAATADAAYGAVAAFGPTAVSGFLQGHQSWIGIPGGLFLCYLGLRTLLAQPPVATAGTGGSQLVTAYTSTFFLTLANPATIVSFIAVFAAFGLSDLHGTGGFWVVCIEG